MMCLIRGLHTGIENVYLEQFPVFNKPGRDPRGPTITIALFALIHSDRCELIATEDAALPNYIQPKTLRCLHHMCLLGDVQKSKQP